MATNPKYEKHLKDRVKSATATSAATRYGVILSYNEIENTATVLLSSPDGTAALGDIVRNVPCPVTIGVQSVAPEPGRPCWISFKNEHNSTPVITHYFNHVYQKYDYERHTAVSSSVPTFLTSM